MGANLTTRGGSRFKAWQLTIFAVIMALAVGGMRSGASWGASGYDAASDAYSMQNVTVGDGAQAWWNAGYTGKGVDVAVIDTGVAPVAGLNAPGRCTTTVAVPVSPAVSVPNVTPSSSSGVPPEVSSPSALTLGKPSASESTRLVASG